MSFYDEDEYIPCVCCNMGNQQENGFCWNCNDLGCPNTPYFGGTEPAIHNTKEDK